MTMLAQTLIVRTHSAGIAASVRSAVAAIDPDLPVTDVMTMRQVLDRSTGDAAFYAHLLEIFAAIALLLAIMGIYGSLSYFVSERTHEIGIRMALGAQRSSVLAMIARLGATLTAIGVVLGGCMALALTRAIAEFLFGVQPTDPLTFCLVAAVLTAVAMAACLIPARRATRVDPMVALRDE